MGRKGFAPVDILIILAGVIAVVGVWYLWAYNSTPSLQDILNGRNQQAANLPKPLGSASSTASSSASAAGSSTVSSAATVAGMIPYMVGPFQSSATDTILALVVSTTAPLTNLITDPKLQNDLSADSYVRVVTLGPMTVGNAVKANNQAAAIDKELNIIGSAKYINGFNLTPGQVIGMDVSGCSLYDGWPNFTCATSVMVPEQWLNSPTNTSITWPGNNGATITLSNISLDSLDAFPGTSTLVMKLAIQSGYGEFCPNAFANYSLGVVTDEKGDVVRPMQPLPTESSTCMGPNETSMIHVIIPFVSSNFPLTVQTFTQNGGRQTFFNVYPLLDHTIVVTPAPSS